MNWKSLSLLGICFALLLYGTVLVFLAFDRDSHSASDTIRPFVITMAPVWIVSIAAEARPCHDVCKLKRPRNADGNRPAALP